MESTGQNILLIDDDPYMHEAVKMILEPEGFLVNCCLTGPDGLAAIRKQAPDLLLLDIMLASPSEGFHLAYEIRKDDRSTHIPIIVLSAVGKTMGMSFAKEVGTDYLPVERFLEKPFEASELREAVQQVLAKKGAAR